MADIYPFKSNYLDLDGLKYHYVDEGHGETVVMLHGNPTWSFYYRNLIKATRGKFRVIVPDHIGCGLSDKPDDTLYSYTLDQRVKDLEQLLSYLEIDSDITLVVHDWGGMIGFCYATRHISAIKRIVVFNTAAFHLPAGKRFPWTLSACQDQTIGSFLVRRLNAFCLAAAYFCSKRSLEDAEREAYLRPYNTWDNRIAIHRFVQDIPLGKDHKSYKIVSRVENTLSLLSHIPMMICWGEKDFIFDMDFFAEWVKRFPDAEIHRFPRAGHYVLEDAFEEIVPLVLKFLG